jgi:hypothetical protein
MGRAARGPRLKNGLCHLAGKQGQAMWGSFPRYEALPRASWDFAELPYPHETGAGSITTHEY